MLQILSLVVKKVSLALKRSDLVNFHKRWYQPSNMKVVVVGDFDPMTMKSYVESYFGCVEDKFEGQIPNSKLLRMSKNLN